MLPRLFALLCIVAHAAQVSADQNVTDAAGACEGEPSALVQLAAKATGNSSMDESSSRPRHYRRAGRYGGGGGGGGSDDDDDDGGLGSSSRRRRRSRRRRSRRRAGTYTGTIPYKVQVGSYIPKTLIDRCQMVLLQSTALLGGELMIMTEIPLTPQCL